MWASLIFPDLATLGMQLDEKLLFPFPLARKSMMLLFENVCNDILLLHYFGVLGFLVAILKGYFPNKPQTVHIKIPILSLNEVGNSGFTPLFTVEAQTDNTETWAQFHQRSTFSFSHADPKSVKRY